MRIVLTIMILLLALPAAACFGPKLYIGVDGSLEQQGLFELVALYVKEKTGTESVAVPLEGKTPLAELASDKLDLAFVPRDTKTERPVLLDYPQQPLLVSGERPVTALQFTTVAPALTKLQGELDPAELSELLQQIAAGAPPAAAARKLLNKLGLI